MMDANNFGMASSTRKQLAKRIRALRSKRGLTQEQFAEKIGIKYKYYQEYEGKRPRDIRLSTLEKIAKGLGMTPAELLTF